MGERFPLDHLGKLLVAAGLALAVLGLLILGGSRFSFFGLGKLPGDLMFRGKNTTVYFPIVSSLVVSVLLTLLIGLISWLSRR
ncbi:MAG TPA: DUF2905 family protein [Terriglobia bacterium]|nr:DUF2905 family protein [Terriglobia bacterium]